MRKKLLSLVVIVAIASSVKAQYDPKALEILDRMSATYNEIDAFKAEFTHSLVNDTEDINEQFQGEITVKGEMFRLKMSGQEIYNNGTTVWTYLPEINEVNIDDYYPDQGDMTPSKIYTAYKKDYKYLFLEEMSEDGEVFQIVDLVPENANTQFFKIRLKIDKDDKILKSWELFDKSGSRYLYSITDFEPNVDIKDSYFEFDPSKFRGLEVIDLR